MKRVLFGLSVVLGFQFNGIARAQSDRPATLELPRATLGLPQRSDSNSLLIPTQHEETVQPAIIAPSVTVPDLPEPKRRFAADDPKSAQDQPIVGNGKTAEPIHAPKTSIPIVSAEEPLFGVPVNAPPFINRDRWRFSHEYLLWWSNGFATPPLLTTGPATSDGIIGQPGVAVLFGNQSAGSEIHNGYRFGFTWWRGPKWGLDGRFFFLSDTGDTTTFSSDTIPMLARPFNDINPPRNFSEVVASPGVLTGGVIVSTSSYLWGADINARRRLCDGCHFNLDALIGYRYMNLTEELNITERSIRINPTSVAPFFDASGTIHGAAAFDSFKTTNHFNGVNLGLAFQWLRGRWVFDVRGTVALGATSASVDIDGGQTLYYTNGNSATAHSGLLALDSNIGHHTASRFSVIPEATFNIGYNITPRCRIFMGYNLIYWSHVLRPGNQIDTTIDSARIPNFGNTNPVITSNPRPVWTPNYSGYFVQGLNFGLSFRW